MNNEQAHLVATDPPYNLAFNTTVKDKFEVFANDQLDDDTFREVIGGAIEKADGYLTKNASVYYCIDWRTYGPLKEMLEEHYHVHNCIVWVKEFGGLGWRYRFRHEFIVFATKSKDHLFNDRGVGEDVWEIRQSKKGPDFILSNQAVYLKTPKGSYIRLTKLDTPTKRAKVVPMDEDTITFSTVQDESTDVWEFSSLNSFQARNQEGHKGIDHPTMKPVGLMARAIKASTLQGETVIDQFAGSGSTLIACEKTNRVCRAIELDPRYCEVIIRRWELLTGKKAKKVES